MTPFRAMFGTDVLPLEWERQVNLGEKREYDDEHLSQILRAIETLLHALTKTENLKVKRWHDKCLKNTEVYRKGEAVFVYFPQDTTAQGRKLSQAWRPMKVMQQLNINVYLLQDRDGNQLRTHVDRIKRAPCINTKEETWDRMSPDNITLRKNVLARRRGRDGWEWKMRTRGRKGFVWQREGI